MKRSSQILLIILLVNAAVKAQEFAEGELSIKITNNNGSTVEIEMELVSPACWDASTAYPHVHNMTDLFGGGTLSTSQNNKWLEFYACWEQLTYPDSLTFGLGYYKFTARVNGIIKDYFYIDYRTSDLPENYNTGGGGDISITFNVSAGKFYEGSTQNEFPTFTTIWDERPWIAASTLELPNFWENALVLVNDGNNHPLLVWGAYPSQLGIDHYNIYKKIGGGQFELYAETEALAYVDESEVIISGASQANETVAYYKLTAVYPTQGNTLATSEYSNTVSTRVAGEPLDKGSSFSYQNELKRFSLFQNYPNPFNPSTVITYHLPGNNFVTLKVYDILGREIATLVNELKDPGSHSVEFNASGLAGGIYLYRIQAGNYAETRKLLLQK